MKISNILYVFVLAILFASGCAKDERLLYQDNDPRIYFPKNKVMNGMATADSVNLSFALEPASVLSDTIFLTFRIMGLAKDYDRPIKLKLAEGSSAIEGYHFEYKDLFMPANAYQVDVPVIIHRRPGLKDSVVSAEFNIDESADFKPGYDEPVTGINLNRLAYKFSVTDKLTKPSIWDTRWQGLFGNYSNTKLVYLTQWTGYKTWNTPVFFPQDQNLLIQQARIGLFDYEQANGPLLDENNVRVLIP